MQNGESNGKRKLEQEEHFPFCVLHFGKNEKMYTENSFRFPFLVSVFLRKWNCYFFCFVLQFRINGEQESENWNAFSVLVFIFDSGWMKMKRKTDKPKRSPYDIRSFCFRSSVFSSENGNRKRKRNSLPVLRLSFWEKRKSQKRPFTFFFWFSRKRKNAGFLFNLTFFCFCRKRKIFLLTLHRTWIASYYLVFSHANFTALINWLSVRSAGMTAETWSSANPK